MARMKIRFYSSIHKSKSIFYHVSWKYIPLPACCSIIDKYRFRQRGKRERQQTSMLLLWWTASTVRFSMSMCSACDVATSPAVGVCWKKNERARKRSWQREQENEKWAQVGPTSAFTSCLFQKGGRGEKEGWLQCRGGVEENKCKMKAFLEATKELYTGKGLGSPQWDWRTHRQNLGRKKACLTMPPGPMLGSKSQSEKQKEEESERQNGNDGPAGKYSSRSSKGGGLVYMLVKRPPCFLSYSFENKLHRQAQSNCIWVWSGFCLGLPKKNLSKKEQPILHVWPRATSQDRRQWKIIKRTGGKGSEFEQGIHEWWCHIGAAVM